MKDILLFISDQHSPLYSGFGGGQAETPVLDEIYRRGTGFDECYTSCPLCVPARMSMLSGMLPSKNGVLTNHDTLSDLTPTFLHPFVAAGYETVLIGRMHFVGRDQRHGFTKRIGTDFTPVTWNRPVTQLKEERGVFYGTTDAFGCVKVIGGGESPVLHYDDMIIKEALHYLKQDHDKPQLIVVGTYAPHFPYVAPPDLYRKYLKQARLPQLFHQTPDYFNPILMKRKNIVDGLVALKAQAAYLAMIEDTDRKIGLVRDAFFEFAAGRSGSPLFCYLSDHGDQVGERDIFGKCTFFEASVKIPLVFEGTGVVSGKRVNTVTSIMDLGPTLCEWAGVDLLDRQDGRSLVSLLQGAADGPASDQPQAPIVVSEMLEKLDGEMHYGIMLRTGHFKYICYRGFEQQDILFDLAADPQETTNVIADHPERAQWFRAYIKTNIMMTEIEARQQERARMADWMTAWEARTGIFDEERWCDNPETAKRYPQIV